MSAVTLADLRAEYEAEVLRVFGSIPPRIETPEAFLCEIRKAITELERSSLDESDRLFVLYKAATIYEVAEGHGLPAAMLFKLSGGNIDPRVSA